MKREYNVIIKTATSHYFQNIITNSDNTPEVLRKIVNRKRGSSNITLTSTIYLQDEIFGWRRRLQSMTIECMTF
jgi:hypothetical protein